MRLPGSHDRRGFGDILRVVLAPQSSLALHGPVPAMWDRVETNWGPLGDTLAISESEGYTNLR